MTPKRLLLTAEASADLDSIADYLENEAGLATSRRVGRQLEMGLHKFADLGGAGSNRSNLQAELRVHVISAWNVYFLLKGDVLLVVRLMHGKRDIQARMFQS